MSGLGTAHRWQKLGIFALRTMLGPSYPDLTGEFNIRQDAWLARILGASCARHAERALMTAF